MLISISNFVLSSGVAIVPLDNKPVLVRCEDSQVLQLEEPEKINKEIIVIKLFSSHKVRRKTPGTCEDESDDFGGESGCSGRRQHDGTGKWIGAKHLVDRCVQNGEQRSIHWLIR